MRMTRKSIAMAAMVSALAISCSQEPADNGAADVNGSAGTESANVAEPDMPNLAGNETAAQALPCPESPGSMCIGPLIVRGEGFNLMREDRASGADNIIAQGTLVFENRTSGPIRFAMLDERITVGLDNGQTLGTTSYSFSGLRFCGRDGAACLQQSPDRFQTLVPGDSPIRMNASFRGDELLSLRAANPSAASATITFQVYAVDAANAGGPLSVSLSVPLRNQIGQ